VRLAARAARPDLSGSRPMWRECLPHVEDFEAILPNQKRRVETPH
jgi:hypothetical protein